MKFKTVENLFLIILLFLGTTSSAFSDNNEIAQTQKKVSGRVIDEQGETGAEDYFCGSYNFDRDGKYTTFTTPYAGLVQVLSPDITYKSGQRFGLYRWHIMDPIRFKKNLKITMQDLGWRHGFRYLPQQSDISSVCFWYQREPHAKFPKLPDWQELEIN